MVWTNWREIRSGVSTFIRLIEPLTERADVDFQIVEAHVRDDIGEEREPEQKETKITKGEESRESASPLSTLHSLRLALGYLRCVLCDIRNLWVHRRELRGQVLVTNEFGCETFPIAMRVLFPFSRIVAIGHTHPGMLTTAQHPVRRMVERLCSGSVNEIVFNSTSLQATWRNKLPSLPKRQTVIHHGLPAPAPELPRGYPAKPDGCVDFICVARFVYWKGHRQLLEAWKQASQRCQSAIRLVLVGDGDEEDSMKTLAAELGIFESVVFLGARENGDLYCNGADVGILLSIEPEAFGLVLLEAMSRGLPMIASNMGGFTEIVEDRVSGFLVDPMSVESVADAIVAMVDDADLRKRMGAASAARWRDCFRAARMLDDYVRVFRDV